MCVCLRVRGSRGGSVPSNSSLFNTGVRRALLHSIHRSELDSQPARRVVRNIFSTKPSGGSLGLRKKRKRGAFHRFTFYATEFPLPFWFSHVRSSADALLTACSPLTQLLFVVSSRILPSKKGSRSYLTRSSNTYVSRQSPHICLRLSTHFLEVSLQPRSSSPPRYWFERRLPHATICSSVSMFTR